MQEPQELSELIHLIYATVGAGPDAWRAVLDSLFRVVDAHMGSVMHFSNGKMQAILVGSGERAQRQYREYFVTVDPWMPVTQQYAVPQGGSLEASHELVPDSVLHQTEFYNDFAKGVGYGYGFGFGIDAGNGVKTVISALRDSCPFSNQEFRSLLLLRPHLQQALRLDDALSTRLSERSAVLHSIDNLAHGIILCDGGGRVIALNSSAERMSSARDGWTITESRFRARLSRDSDKVNMLIAKTVNAGTAGGFVSIQRPSGARPWMITITRYGGSAFRSLSCIVVTDPEAAVRPDPDVIRDLYQFTPAEIRLALLLVNGERVETAARTLRITVNTARTHLKRMLSKASVRSQTELIALLSKIPASTGAVPGLGDDPAISFL